MRLKHEPASEPLHISAGRMAALGHPSAVRGQREREFFIHNLLVRIHFINVMIRRTGLAPWEFDFPFPQDEWLHSDILRRYGVKYPPADFDDVASMCLDIAKSGLCQVKL